MVDDQEYQEEPLNFEQPSSLYRCPYCGETVSTDELGNFLDPESNTFVCPNCRKKLNLHELGGGI